MKRRYAARCCLKVKLAVFLIFMFCMLINISVLVNIVEASSELERHVHRYINMEPYGNWTLIDKPMFPVYFNESQVTPGSNWTVICPLTANRSYHIYCYGSWIDYGSTPSTDYDIYVYNPYGELEGYHTESAGLPEHLGTTVDDPLFIPDYSGNYTFIIRNDPRESIDSEEASLMIIERIACNAWHKHFLRGKENELPILETSWAFEFQSNSQHVEVLIKVPETLDIYEGRIYLMANSQTDIGEFLNGYPLAWEDGLYGEKKDVFGGYNLDSEEYRGVAYASCEFHGQDMLVNFTSPYVGESLYHLVFIGEAGSGTIEFVVKTEFQDPCLKPLTIPERAYPHNDTVVAYTSNSTDLKNGTLEYSINNWKNTTTSEIEIIDNRHCRAVIPGQDAGTTVNYMIRTMDILENILITQGNYTVKHDSTLNLSIINEKCIIGENITFRGHLTPPNENLPVNIRFTSPNGSQYMTCYTFPNGTFKDSYRPKKIGIWKIEAEFKEDEFRYGTTSSDIPFKVTEPPLLVKYGIFIGGGLGAAFAVAVIIYIKKSRE